MTLEQLAAGIDFVSDTPPANAGDGDTFLDTSLNPPQVKVFDGSVSSFVRPQTAQNLDQKVSNAGAGIKISGAFDVTNAELLTSFFVGSQDSSANDIAVSPDGSSLYIIGRTTTSIYQYSLSAPFDVSTASLSSSFDIGSEDGIPKDVTFGDDGSSMYVTGANTEKIYQYNLTTPFDITTASLTSSFSVLSQEDKPNGVSFSTDGTAMFMIGNSNDSVFEYSLSTAFDLTTASFTSSFDVSSQELTPTGIAFRPDGSRMYVSGDGNDDIHQYALSTTFDVTSARFSRSFDVSSEDGSPQGVTFSTDGSRMYLCGEQTDTVFQYAVGQVVGDS
jgi:sugar lactone lactonase YvrE